LRKVNTYFEHVKILLELILYEFVRCRFGINKFGFPFGLRYLRTQIRIDMEKKKIFNELGKRGTEGILNGNTTNLREWNRIKYAKKETFCRHNRLSTFDRTTSDTRAKN